MKDIEKIYEVVDNGRESHKTWRMTLKGDMSAIVRPGQFVNLLIEDKYLRRPISVCDYGPDRLVLLYDVVGAGTRAMSQYKPGHKINTLTGLGNGFDIDNDSRRPLLLGGGIGCAPLLALAKALQTKGLEPVVILGFNTEADVVMEKDFTDLGLRTVICTVDGSYGHRGFVTDAIADLGIEGDYFYACGPTPMLKAVAGTLTIDGQISMEARMGCGFGACMCCSIETSVGPMRICKEGPVFPKDNIIWK